MASDEENEENPGSVYQVNVQGGSSGLRVGNFTKICFYQASPDSSTPGHSGEERVRQESGVYQSYCRQKISGLFVETTPCKRVKKIIEADNTLVIIGHSGYGKTALLHYIAANPMEGYLPIPCKTAKQIKKYIGLVRGTNIKLLFVVDQPFGGSYIQQRLVDSWANIGEDLEMYLHEHKFLFACRSSVWADCKVHFDTSPFFCQKVEISPASFTVGDRRELLGKYLGNSGKLTDSEIDAIVSIKSPVAFCQCCKLMGDAIQSGQSGDELVQIFKTPFSYLSSELKNMNEVKFATLCLVMLCGHIKCAELTCVLSKVTPAVKERIEVIWETCGCEGPLHVAVKNLQECAERSTGIFLEKIHKTGENYPSCEVYTFAHDSVREAVTMQYGDRHFRHCLQYLPHDIVVKIARPHNYSKHEHEFAVCVPDDTEYNEDLAEVFTEVAIVGSWALHNVFQNPFVREENFQRDWCRYLRSCPDKLKAFIDSKSWDGSCIDCLSYRSYALTLLRFLVADLGVKCTCQTDSSDPLSKAVSLDDTPTVRNLITSQRQADPQICQAFLTACRHGSMNVLRMLIHDINNDRLDAIIEAGLKSACYGGHRETVEFLLEKYYSPCRAENCSCGEGLMRASGGGHSDIVHILLSHGADINFTDNLGWTSLHWAAWHGHIQIVQTLLHHGVDINFTDKQFGRTGLHLAAKYGHAQIVRKFLHHAADQNIKDRWSCTAMHLAEEEGHREIVDMLAGSGDVVGMGSELEDSDTVVQLEVDSG